MGSGKTSHFHNKKKAKRRKSLPEKPEQVSAEKAPRKKLEIVLKCDTSGCLDAVVSSIKSINLPGVEIDIISSGVGSINKSDIFMAETGSRLITGFNVGVIPHIDLMALEHTIEIRLYDVIYRLLEDVESICRSIIPHESAEEIIGTAKVIALFKSSRKGIILGCEVLSGKLALGKKFRVLGAMGQLYVGTIKSLHIEESAVSEARKGQQVGLKVRDFNKVKIGDLVESFQAVSGQGIKPWKPKGKVYYP